MKEKLLNAIELIGESTIKLPLKYLNGDNICVKVTKNGEHCLVTDEAGLYNALSNKAKANFASFVNNWKFEFYDIKIMENNALVVESTLAEYTVGTIGSFVSALLMINDFAERGEYRREYYIVH